MIAKSGAFWPLVIDRGNLNLSPWYDHLVGAGATFLAVLVVALGCGIIFKMIGVAGSRALLEANRHQRGRRW